MPHQCKFPDEWKYFMSFISSFERFLWNSRNQHRRGLVDKRFFRLSEDHEYEYRVPGSIFKCHWFPRLYWMVPVILWWRKMWHLRGAIKRYSRFPGPKRKNLPRQHFLASDGNLRFFCYTMNISLRAFYAEPESGE